jgi:endonuclease-3 related protein
MTDSTPLRRIPNRARLMAIYRRLDARFGPQHWWPAETACEMIVGAILTQNTAWTNVEKAMAVLRDHRLLDFSVLHKISEQELAPLIRSSGFFNLKAKRLKAFSAWIVTHHDGSAEKMFSGEGETLRETLLGIDGIGPETADSILLYAGRRPIFVVDAYTRRLFLRHGLIRPSDGYVEVQALFMKHLPHDAALFNQYHALIVRTDKEYCTRSNPDCAGCPLFPLPRWLESHG